MKCYSIKNSNKKLLWDSRGNIFFVVPLAHKGCYKMCVLKGVSGLTHRLRQRTLLDRFPSNSLQTYEQGRYRFT